MKRVEVLANRIIQQIGNTLSLSGEQVSKMKQNLLPVLGGAIRKTKQQVYGETVKRMGKLGLKEYQFEPVLDILYNRYFMHFEVILECEEVEAKRKSQIQISDNKKINEDRVMMEIEVPYQCKPLKQAREVIIKRGVALDPTYLD